MELLLVKDVPGLGSAGQIVKVATGYARNFLLPRGFAQVPTPLAVEEVKAKAAKAAAEREAQRVVTMEVAQKLARVEVSFTMKAGKEGHLYGSVGARQISEFLREKGFEVDEKNVLLDQPLKETGEFDVPISLHPEVQVPVKVAVHAEEEPSE